MTRVIRYTILVILSLIVSLMWVKSKFWFYDREEYLSKKVLELSVPFDVTIDIEFLKNLAPADDTSGTSPKGF